MQWPHYEAYVFDLEWLQRSWEAYWAYLAPWASPLGPSGRMARPSSGWHMARLALERCDTVNMYGFSMSSDKFHCECHVALLIVEYPERLSVTWQYMTTCLHACVLSA